MRYFLVYLLFFSLYLYFSNLKLVVGHLFKNLKQNSKEKKRETYLNFLLSAIDASSARVMQKPSKQKTATPPTNGRPHKPLKAFLLSGWSKSCRSSFITMAMARTLHASANILNGASEDRDRMKERAISKGKRRAKMKREGGDEKTEERFWPMKTRYATEPPA